MTAFRLALALALTLLGTVLAAQEAYNVRRGDTLRIEVIEDPSLNRTVLVSPDGRVSLPLAGSVLAAGQPVEAIQSALSAALASNFAAPPSVFVSVERLAEARPASGGGAPAAAPTIEVYVLGEVGRPGVLQVAPGTTVLQLFAQMGGFTGFAATKRIQLRRTVNGVEETYLLDYDAILSGQSANGGAGIVGGDVLIVPQRRLFE